MPQMKPEFTIAAPTNIVWEYLSNMENIGSCVPGCTVEVVDDIHSKWKMQVKAGPLKKTLKMDSTVEARDDQAHHVEFDCVGNMVDVHGMCDADDLGNGATEVHFLLDMQAKGSAAGFMNGIIDTQLPKYQDAFVDSVKQALES